MYLLRTSSSRRRITETMMKSLSLRASPQAATAATASTTASATTAVRMPAPALPRSAFRALDLHASRFWMTSRHRSRDFSSHLTVAAAAAAADASEAAASVAAGGVNGIDLVGAQHEEEEKLPESFAEFNLDDRVTVRRLECKERWRVKWRHSSERETSILVVVVFAAV